MCFQTVTVKDINQISDSTEMCDGNKQIENKQNNSHITSPINNVATESSIEELLQYIRHLKERTTKREKTNEIVEEWQQLSAIIDTFMFGTCLLSEIVFIFIYIPLEIT